MTPPLDLDAIERAIGEYTEGAALIAEVRSLRAQLAELTARCHNCGHHKTEHNLPHNDCGGQVVMRLDCRCHRYVPSPEES